MENTIYFGRYLRFDHPRKKEGAMLLGADNLVGDSFDIEFITENGTSYAWLKNKFGAYVGHFDQKASRELRIINARGWTMTALLSFVAYTDKPEPGRYWGQMAVVAYDPRYAASFEPYLSLVSQKLMDGIRPDVNLGIQAVQEIIDAQGNWKPRNTVALPSVPTGTLIMKSRRKLSEKAIEAGRAGNIGCYIVSIAFLVACAAAVFFLLKGIGIF